MTHLTLIGTGVKIINMEFRNCLYSEVIEEITPMLIEHHKEVWVYPDSPLDIDHAAYLKMEQNGIYKSYAAVFENKIVGYSGYIISAHVHHKTEHWAYSDVIYIDPAYRGHGLEFISYCENELKSINIDVVVHSVTPNRDYSKALVRSGYDLMEMNYTKRLS